jgi:uncharacterized membrane protein YdjX (TVP38/TMEM64 family)
MPDPKPAPRPAPLRHPGRGGPRGGRRIPAAAWVAFAWLTLLGATAAALRANDLTLLDAAEGAIAFLAERPLGWLGFIALCALRPLFGFSSSLLSIAAGHLYGPAFGFVVVTLGHNAGALVAYALSRRVAGGWAERALRHERLRGVGALLRERTFATVLTLRLAYAPFDAVNHAAGALRLRLGPFLAGSALGSLLGSLTFLTFGASLPDLRAADGVAPRLRPETLAASAALLIASLAVARWLRRRSA